MRYNPRRADASVARPHTDLISRRNPFPMHYESHQTVIDELEARILTIRDSL
jgi:hypothetical protein